MKNERTSKRVARIAGKVMARRGIASKELMIFNDDAYECLNITWSDVRALAASCLTQAADKKRG
jgi:hypothetical protein